MQMRWTARMLALVLVGAAVVVWPCVHVIAGGMLLLVAADDAVRLLRPARQSFE